MWQPFGGEAWISAKRSGKLVLHQRPLTTPQRQLQRNWTETREKKMWFESSTVPHKGHVSSLGPFSFNTSTPEGIRPWIHCHKKILIFRGSLVDQIVSKGAGPGVTAMARYRDLLENFSRGL